MRQVVDVQVSKPQRRRSDAGIIKFTDRDAQLLGWIADQYAIRVDQLTRLMERKEPTCRQWMNRMRAAGYLNYRVILAGEPTWMWPTRAGLRAVDRPYRTWEPSPSVLSHLAAINQARIFYERVCAKTPGAYWTSERNIRYHAEAERRAAGGGGAIGHMPDGLVLITFDETIAIEVELSAKTARATFDVIDGLLQHYFAVHYFVSPAARHTVEEAAHWVMDRQERTGGRAWDNASGKPMLVTPIAELWSTP